MRFVLYLRFLVWFLLFGCLLTVEEWCFDGFLLVLLCCLFDTGCGDLDLIVLSAIFIFCVNLLLML